MMGSGIDAFSIEREERNRIGELDRRRMELGNLEV